MTQSKLFKLFAVLTIVALSCSNADAAKKKRRGKGKKVTKTVQVSPASTIAAINKKTENIPGKGSTKSFVKYIQGVETYLKGIPLKTDAGVISSVQNLMLTAKATGLKSLTQPKDNWIQLKTTITNLDSDFGNKLGYIVIVKEIEDHKDDIGSAKTDPGFRNELFDFADGTLKKVANLSDDMYERVASPLKKLVKTTINKGANDGINCDENKVFDTTPKADELTLVTFAVRLFDIDEDLTTLIFEEILKEQQEEKYILKKDKKWFLNSFSKNNQNIYHHIGIYSYKTSILKKFVSLNQTLNEKQNRLEQLRALDNNLKISVALANFSPIGVDTKEDYLAIKKIMEYKS